MELEISAEREALELERLRGDIAIQELNKKKIGAEIRKTEADAWFIEMGNKNRDSDPETRRVYHFYGDTGETNVKKAIAELTKWSHRDAGQPIEIIFTSPGGSVTDGLALYDCIQGLRNVGHPVTTTALGMAASMGGILLQSGEKRVMGSNAWMLIHEVSAGAVGNVSEIEDKLLFMKRLQQTCLGILAHRSTLSIEEIEQRWKNKDWWLTAEESLELGFIDEIL